MPLPTDRTSPIEYPGCRCEIFPPEPAEWLTHWWVVCAWAMGYLESGNSGVVTSGRLLCSCTAQQMIDHFTIPP